MNLNLNGPDTTLGPIETGCIVLTERGDRKFLMLRDRSSDFQVVDIETGVVLRDLRTSMSVSAKRAITNEFGRIVKIIPAANVEINAKYE